jgi:predicted Zn finger-like uncharacterized protein
MTEEHNIECPNCEAPIAIPLGDKDGEVTCTSCNSLFAFGRKEQESQVTMEMANTYALFIAPAMLALNERVIEFTTLYPDSNLFDEDTIEKTHSTIEGLKAMIADGS